MIPEPVSVTEKPGSFYLRQGATLAVEGDSLAGIAVWLTGQVQEQTGILLKEEKGHPRGDCCAGSGRIVQRKRSRRI